MPNSFNVHLDGSNEPSQSLLRSEIDNASIVPVSSGEDLVFSQASPSCNVFEAPRVPINPSRLDNVIRIWIPKNSNCSIFYY